MISHFATLFNIPVTKIKGVTCSVEELTANVGKPCQTNNSLNVDPGYRVFSTTQAVAAAVGL